MGDFGQVSHVGHGVEVIAGALGGAAVEFEEPLQVGFKTLDAPMDVVRGAQKAAENDFALAATRDLVVHALPVREREEALHQQVFDDAFAFLFGQVEVSMAVLFVPEQIQGFREHRDEMGFGLHAAARKAPATPERLNESSALHRGAGVLVRTWVDFVPGDTLVPRHEFAGVQGIAVHVSVPVIAEEIGGVHGGKAFQDGRSSAGIAVLAFHAIENGQIARHSGHAVGFLLTDGAAV